MCPFRTAQCTTRVIVIRATAQNRTVEAGAAYSLSITNAAVFPFLEIPFRIEQTVAVTQLMAVAPKTLIRFIVDFRI
jgi:hypothetical protein